MLCTINNVRSHPTWVRGLKLDLWLGIDFTLYVAPYVGAWIETHTNIVDCTCHKSHPTWVRGLKQNEGSRIDNANKVAPYVGAWIETNEQALLAHTQKSHPTWVRGLKPFSRFLANLCLSRTLRGCVD